jgi:hypothetical protein
MMFRLKQGPLVDRQGNEQRVFWVECVGCGSDWPMLLGADGKHYVPPELTQIQGLDEGGNPVTPVFYATDGCRRRGYNIVAAAYDGVAKVVHVPHPEVELVEELERGTARVAVQ